MSKMSALSQAIDNVKEQMCDEYCKYPYEYEDSEMLEVICNKCPLNRLDGEVWTQEQ